MKTPDIFAPIISCPRHARLVCDVECCVAVCATECREDLEVCRSCAHGQAIAKTARMRADLPPVKSFLLPCDGQTAPVLSPEKEECEEIPVTQKIAAHTATQESVYAPAPAPEDMDVIMRVQLARTLARLLKDYPMSKSHGLRFIVLAASNFGFEGSQDDASRLLLEAGLRMASGRPAIRVDDAMRDFAKRSKV